MHFPTPHNNVCLTREVQSFANDFQEYSVNDGSAFVTLLYSAHETICLSVSFPDEKDIENFGLSVSRILPEKN